MASTISTPAAPPTEPGSGTAPQPDFSLAPIPGLPPCLPANDIEKVISIITKSFASVPLTTTFITEIDGTPPPYPSPTIDSARLYKALPTLTPIHLQQHFAPGLQTLNTSGALILTTQSHAAISIWEPPSYAGAPFTALGSAGPIRANWRTRIEAAKARELRGQPFWHLGFLARNFDAEEKVDGAVSAVVKPVLQEARRTRTPVWLEAVDERGVAIYEGWGFEVVERVLLGEGVYAGDGWPVEGRDGVQASGVRGWCMVYRPWAREGGVGAAVVSGP